MADIGGDESSLMMGAFDPSAFNGELVQARFGKSHQQLKTASRTTCYSTVSIVSLEIHPLQFLLSKTRACIFFALFRRRVRLSLNQMLRDGGKAGNMEVYVARGIVHDSSRRSQIARSGNRKPETGNRKLENASSDTIVLQRLRACQAL